MKKSEPAIEIKNLSKKFVIPKYNRNSLKEIVVHGWLRNEKTEKQVLDNISFTINKGDFFGIVGRNGSGKSTLLKLIAGVYAPDEGEIKLHGKITPFIELGVGFNPELSGRDNVFLNGALLGFTRKQMEAMYDEIVDFAELHEFMDLKLKNYSSGMQVRLAFSIAIKAKNDILIFDEVLAVGDEAFQRKCMNVFEKYRRSGQTIVLVTHSMENVRRLCTKAMMLADGKIEIMGSVKTVAAAYQKANAVEEEASIKVRNQKEKSHISIKGCEVAYYRGDVLNLQIRWPKTSQIRQIEVAIFGLGGEYIFSSMCKTKSNSTGVKHSIDLNLGPGTYYLNVTTFDKNGDTIEALDKIATFLMHDDFEDDVKGLARLKYKYTEL